ncbi:hypothetical protein R3P38DRAFT_3239949 [Favolaschia claudopus]|uniref:Proteophosphoglycan ppg4 n=1 Tax=Favolaschia claudopus TaxID=2862362 RepID=A0AAV9Z7S6_9AGAR
MPRAGSSENKRKRTGQPPKKPGKEGWVHGTKLTFFENMRDEFIACAATKTQGDFYSRAATTYLKTYGYHTAWESDLEEGQDVADDVDEDEDVDSLPVEEATSRADYFHELRRKIGVWFNAHYGGGVQKRKTGVTGFKKLFDKPELAPPAPHKPQVLHFYPRHFYTERIKPRVIARLAAHSRLQNPPAPLAVRNQVIRECWMAETAEFRAEVIEAMEKEHAAALAAYKTAVENDAPATASEYGIALDNAAFYLQPFADAAQERFGMNVSIMLCGPIPDHGGNIEVRSVHAGFSNGLAPRIWSDFDRAGFDAAQRSFVHFTRHCFTEDECRARALGSHSGPAETQDGSEESGDAGAATPSNDASSQPSTSLQPPAGPTTPVLSVSPPSPPPQSTPPPPPPPPPANANANGLRQLGEEEDMSFPLQLLQKHQHSGVLSGTYDFDDDFEWDIFAASTGGRVVSRALATAIAVMPDDEALEYMKNLNCMSDVDFDRENMLAEQGRALTTGDADQEPPPAPPPNPNPTVPPTTTPDPETREEQRGDERPRPKAKPAWRGKGGAADHGRNEEEGGGRVPLADTAANGQQTDEERGEEGGRDREREERVAEDAWDHDDEDSWPAELKGAFAAFKRIRELGGSEWECCVRDFVTLERVAGFVSKGLMSAPQGGSTVRPQEVPWFMQHARRKWDKRVPLTSPAGPITDENSFSRRWQGWWARGQPESRQDADGSLKGIDVVAMEDWEEFGTMNGKNGLLLYLGALLWWGEAVCESGEESEILRDEWKAAVKEVASVLAVTVKAVKKNSTDMPRVQGTEQVGRPKRKRAGSAAEVDKENVDSARQLRKRAKAAA